MIGRGFFLFLTRRLMIFASRHIENDLRNDFFRHLQRLTPGFYHANPTGDLMALATNDLAAVRQMAGPGIMYTVNTAVAGTFVIVNLLLISPLLTAACLATGPVMAFAVYRFGRAIHRRFERIQAQFGELTARTQENLAGVRVIRSYAREEIEKKLFEESNREYLRLNRNYVLIESAFRPAIMVIVGAGTLIMLFLGGRFIIEGRITLGEFTAFAIYLGILIWPAIAIGWVTGLFQRGSASMKRIQRVLETEPLVSDGPDAAAVDRDEHRIEIRDLSFRYSGDGPLVLKNITAAIEPGTTTAIVGPTGAGKTTLLNLLAHLYPVERGRILIGGRDINDVSLVSLRGLFGFVPQEVFLFSDTIESNIAFGVAGCRSDGGQPSCGDGAFDGGEGRDCGEVDDDSVATAARLAAFDEEVAEFPDGYATMLGERGINLSGGQKQRCAIARAVLKDPAILILDDALSAVDTRTEDRILENLKEAVQGRTAIIVSHRVSAVRHADQILVLRDGVIEERGVHDELVRAGGLYADMVEQQRLKSEIEVI
jgi:ATP-binding cassette subfamily B protein